MDNTLVVVLIMAGVAVLLLLGAVVADRRLMQRMERRQRGEEARGPAKPDAADAVIQLLDRTRGVVRQTLDGAAGEEEGKG